MNLDIRTPMGLMFTLLGAIIMVFGVVSNAEIYKRSLGFNINLWWGLVMVLFGIVMLLLAWRASGASGKGPDSGAGH